MTVVNATQARKEFFDLIKDALAKHTIFRIHHREGDVVLMSEDEYESLQETLELLSIPGFRESIKRSLKQIEKGETYSLDEVFGETD
ncbi:MAG: type II toxin-antitoxin system Phd/YefM family antitoxin [Nitrospirae bacterium]|nr:type II toxin-antitoxin system Phd/YefM family antitoxin [Nitrospirota bacterium]MCL5238023.1 type II toxin-antitoxin system Phd/YefM family antitoxin [Nitrospirota bacterium]